MRDKPYEIVDGKIYPKMGVKKVGCSGEISGGYWSAWPENAKYFLEYDKGHFATKMVTCEISEDEYKMIHSSPPSVNEVINRLQNADQSQ